MKTIGILAIQGDVGEHVWTMERALQSKGGDNEHNSGSVILVRTKDDVAAINALVIPGGESTTISRVMQLSGIYAALLERVRQRSLPIMGTCAGCILLARKIVEPEEIHTLETMDIEVERNAFGRQKESFEVPINFANFDFPINAVFIRGPRIVRNWSNSQVLATYNDQIVAVRQDEFLALSFHPELTDDLRIHQYFLDMV